MPDMLVKLYELPPIHEEYGKMRKLGITVRPALPAERNVVLNFVKTQFSPIWEGEAAAALGRMPVSCHIAVRDGEILGFACWEASARDFFGPTGIIPEARGKGVGRALLISCLSAMRDYGYGYAIVGSVGPAEFYEKACGAKVIKDSFPGIYEGMLKERDNKV